MLVKDIMHRNPVTVSPEASLEEAYRLMQERRFRHLPVLEEGRLVGVVTDRDLRLATSELVQRPFHPDARVRDVMTENPRTASPLDAVEDAARLMRELKIGCLPVVDGDLLLGIVTGIDLLDALLKLTGVDKPSSRVEVELEDKPGELSRLAHFFGSRNINIHSLLTYPDSPTQLRTVLRIGSIESRLLADGLRKEGFEVAWPPAKPWRT
jgi:acetoin utilization protein AcuB